MAGGRGVRGLAVAPIGVLVAIGITGCTNTKPASSPTPTSNAVGTGSGGASSTTAAIATPNVQAQLLQLSDLPAGWSVNNSPSSNASEPPCFKNATDFKSQERAKAEAKFQNGSNGVPALNDEVVFMPNAAKAAMSKFAQLMAGCAQVSFTSDGHTFRGTIAPMSFPAFGVETQAYQMNVSTTASGLNITAGFDFVLSRFANDEILLVAYGDIGTPDISQVQQYVQKAAAKVSAA